MVGSSISLPPKWEQFLKNLADDHDIDLNAVVSQLCEWAFSDPESKEQFRIWLDEAYSAEGEAEEEARAVGEEAAEEEEENEEESEEESHEHRD
ncbi:MAG: hypothetical protein ABSD73_03060 [Candidatus Bathyarchaeia archaeon]|jgi:hypothetical protein